MDQSNSGIQVAHAFEKATLMVGRNETIRFFNASTLLTATTLASEWINVSKSKNTWMELDWTGNVTAPITVRVYGRIGSGVSHTAQVDTAIQAQKGVYFRVIGTGPFMTNSQAGLTGIGVFDELQVTVNLSATTTGLPMTLNGVFRTTP